MVVVGWKRETGYCGVSDALNVLMRSENKVWVRPPRFADIAWVLGPGWSVQGEALFRLSYYSMYKSPRDHTLRSELQHEDRLKATTATQRRPFQSTIDRCVLMDRVCLESA